MERAGRLIRKLKLPAETASTEDLVLAAWPMAVGKRIASHTRPVALVRERLVVEVEDAIWQRQLWALRGQILDKLFEVLGPGAAGTIEFRVAVARRMPQREERVRIPADESSQIQDPILRKLYQIDRKKATA
jgi:predicted nucleic acid-binding Zn ribbon protein